MTAAPDDHPSFLEFLKGTLRGHLRLAEDAPIDPRRSFLEYGFDSLMAVEFRDLLAQKLERPLPSTLLFDHPNPEAVAAFLAPDDRESRASDAPVPLSQTEPGDLGEGALRELVRRQADQLRLLEERATEPIAVIGIGCRLPGNVNHPDDLMALLTEGRDAISEVPADRWDAEALYDADEDAPGRIHSRSGGFLEDGIRGFDAAMFGISPREAVQLDPQQRLLLETTWHALEHAGISPDAWRGERVGVFVGMRASEYFDSQCNRGPEDAESYYATGNALSTAAGRLSFNFGWTGPCFALDTACSSSLVAVHEAVQSLRQGHSTATIAAGVNLLIDPLSSISICKAHMLAADGRCKTFDANADGYGRAEGCGVVILKRLAHARRDGDRILGLIRGTAINQDGRSAGLTVPHGPSQEAVLRAALLDGRLEPQDVDYIEAHGTGTELGDPIEVGALDAVFGESHGPGGLLTGSVKTNLGHLECAAGIAGLIKVLLTLDEDRLPSHLHLKNPNPHIDWARTVVRVPTTPTPWPERDRVRRAGVSSFGFSGTNAHVVVEQHRPVADGVPIGAPQILALAARDPAALQDLATSSAHWLREQPDADLHAVCATAARGRAPLPRRLAVIGETTEEIAGALLHASDAPADRAFRADAPRLAFVFTGQGAQHPGMTKGLYQAVPTYREFLDQAVAALDPHLEAPLLEVLFGDDERIHETRWTQPALFATGYAMARTWRALGVEPAVVAGHSIGEITAATVAGLCSLEDGARWIAVRGRAMHDTAAGAMVAIQGDPTWVGQQVAKDAERVAVAAFNGPRLTVVSGAPTAVEQIAQRAEAEGLSAHRLEVQRAFHSPLMGPALDPLRTTLDTVRWRRPEVPLVSFLDPTARTAQLTEAGYWVRHAREPVAFHAGMDLLATKADVFLECGPHPVLLGMARAFLPRGLGVIPSLRRGAGDAGAADLRTWLRALGDLFEEGVQPNWDAWFGTHHRRTPLPGYPFQRQDYWLERRAVVTRTDVSGHPMLGRRVFAAPLGGDDHLFENVVSRERPKWVVDHQVFHKIIMPGAAYLELGLLAAREIHRPSALADVVIQAPLLLGEASTLLQTHVGADGSVALHARVMDADEETPWTTLATARLTTPGMRPGVVDLAQLAVRLPSERAPAEFYAAFLEVGLAYGPLFQGVRSLRVGPREALATLSLDPGLDGAQSILHPALLDACFQVTAAAIPHSERTWLPVGAGGLSVFENVPTEVMCHVQVMGDDDPGHARSLTVDVTLMGPDGTVVAVVERLQLLPATPSSLLPALAAEDAYGIQWELVAETEEAQPPSGGSWLLVGTEGWEALETELGQREGPVLRAPAGDVQGLLEVWTQTPRHVVFLQDGHRDLAAGALCQALLRTLNAAATAELPERPRVTVVTRGASTVAAGGPTRPECAALHGMCHVAALEYPALDVGWVDLDPRPDSDEVARLIGVLDQSAHEDSDQPRRLAFRAGQIRTPMLARAGRQRRVRALAEPYRIALREYGALDTLHPARLDLPDRPPTDHVRVRLEASALNFKDVLYALGMLGDQANSIAAADRSFGFEACGIVEAVGERASVVPGSRVLVSAPGCFATHVDVPELAVMPCPSNQSPIAGATVQTVYFTALYGLERLAELQRGETVLIHAAAGGVGQAAIRVAQRIGARILATASVAKHEALRQQGVLEVFDSRTAAFADQVLATTDGRGVDVVLNCLNGGLADASARSVAQGGRFVEIGKIDVWDEARWRAERPDVHAYRFDLEELFPAEPDLLTSLRADLSAALQDGSLAPIPHTTFAAADAGTALTYLAQAQAIGKVVLRWPSPTVRRDGSYLITGGSGAVAEAMARELARRGARHLILASRSPSRVSGDLRSDLETAGVTVRASSCDVGDLTALRAVFADAIPAVTGIVHAAGVLDDAPLASLTDDGLHRVLGPKVDGLRNLLKIAPELEPLDFLLVISSVTGWFGNPGQGNYAAANAAVDAMCATAAARGLPACSLAFGPWAGAGMAEVVGGADGEALRERGMPPLVPASAARAAIDAVADQWTGMALATMRWRRFLGRWPQVPRFFRRFVDDTATAPAGPSRSATEDWSLVPAGERLARVSAILTEELARVLGFPDAAALPTDRPFPDLGVDSLMAVESRNGVEARLGVSLSATALFDHPTVAELAAHLVTCLPVAAADPENTTPTEATEVTRLQELDQDELIRQLQAELADDDGADPEVTS